jgi:hypothetical protein
MCSYSIALVLLFERLGNLLVKQEPSSSDMKNVPINMIFPSHMVFQLMIYWLKYRYLALSFHCPSPTGT